MNEQVTPLVQTRFNEIHVSSNCSSDVHIAPSFESTSLENGLLTGEHKEFFIENGFLQLNKLIPQDLVHSALDLVKSEACERKAWHWDQFEDRYILQGVDKKLKKHPTIMALRNHPSLWNILAQMIGSEENVKKYGAAQIAIRDPEEQLDTNFERCNTYSEMHPISWHADGLREGLHSPFAINVGIALTDHSEPFQGNLTVLPGSHRLLNSHLKAALKKYEPYWQHYKRKEKKKCFGPDLVRELWEPVQKMTEFYDDGGVQLLRQPGDVSIIHQKLWHCTSPNLLNKSRCVVYFRIANRATHTYDQLSTLEVEDIWFALPGLAQEAKLYDRRLIQSQKGVESKRPDYDADGDQDIHSHVDQLELEFTSSKDWYFSYAFQNFERRYWNEKMETGAVVVDL